MQHLGTKQTFLMRTNSVTAYEIPQNDHSCTKPSLANRFRSNMFSCVTAGGETQR